MYSNQFGTNVQEFVNNSSTGRGRREVFLEGASFVSTPVFTKVAPAAAAARSMPIPQKSSSEDIVYNSLKPIIVLLRLMGIFPVAAVSKGIYQITPPMAIYSVFLFLVMVGYLGYMKWDNVEIVKSAEGRFEEAVIGYLFTVYLIPIIILPLSWLECRKIGKVFGDWSVLERIYERVENKNLPLYMGSTPLVISLALPSLATATMIVTHVTMVYFRVIQVIPYCFVNAITFVVGGFWYLQCDVIGKVATIIADDFEQALKNIGPSGRVAEFRSLWMLLAKITRDYGLGSCYVFTFLCLYLFLIITLTIYGLLSTLQYGFSIKDVGLTIIAVFSIALLYFICDEAHYASNCVRVNFQKKILLVELSWMNDDAQQEIAMFLRATEMNPTDMSLGGFFDVNRILFKSLLATMVTYLVVLLQFQISIPEETMEIKLNNGTTIPLIKPKE